MAYIMFLKDLWKKLSYKLSKIEMPDIDMESLKKLFSRSLEELKDLNFYIVNPLLWIGIFIVFIFLWRRWPFGKTFLFCFLVSAILLSMTKIEHLTQDTFALASGSMPLLLIRVFAGFTIIIMIFYYTFMKD